MHSIDKLFCSVRFDQMCSENVKKALNNGNFEIEDDKDQILGLDDQVTKIPQR